MFRNSSTASLSADTGAASRTHQKGGSTSGGGFDAGSLEAGSLEAGSLDAGGFDEDGADVMVQMSSDEVAQAAHDLKLINDRQLREIWSMLGSRDVSSDDLTQALIGQELLTSYQLGRLKSGEKSGYFYGDYKVLYFVGSGSFARVYRVVQQATGQVFALKVLRSRYGRDSSEAGAQVRDQFRREAELGMTLRHSNIVPIYDVGVEGDAHYMVMDFVEGRNLRDFVEKRNQCDADESLRLIMDVLSGLDYAFQRGIAHRDIKLSNVLVSSRGTAKLVDFGLAELGREVTDDAFKDIQNPRTIDYAALERATGVRRDDLRSDIYFVGCMLYHMLSGKSPLPDTKNRMKRLSKARYQEIVPIRKLMPGLHSSVVALVNRSLEFDATRRYQTPKEFLIDAQHAIRKLDEPPLDQAHDDDTVVEEEDSRAAREAKPQRTVMFVEANVQMQNVFRQHFKTAGFRVLVTRDPERAIARFTEDDPPGHCVVFSTQDLGEAAVNAYQRFICAGGTSEIPAVLLLGEKHTEWSQRSDGAEHHVVVPMPITLGEFRELLDRLVPHAAV
ncbi:MAG: serine/threonine-protein kinase [Pirellulales bacterium]